MLDPVPADLTAALLEKRPDVWSAWQRMEAARYRIGSRKAQLYPQIRLDATVGLQAGSFADLFRVDQYFFNLVGGLLQPIFQGGRLRANVGVAEAQFQAQAANYVRTVLTAFKEVQVSLVNLDNQAERYESLRRQTTSAAGSVDYQLRSFQRGVGNYISYLDARQNLASFGDQPRECRAFAGRRPARRTPSPGRSLGPRRRRHRATARRGIRNDGSTDVPVG